MMDEKPKSNVLRTLLIILGVLVGCCVLCYASQFLLAPIVAPLLEQQAESFAPILMETLVESSGGEVQFSGDFGTDFFAAFETTTPTVPPPPTSTPTVFEPSATPTEALPPSAGCVPQGERVRGLVTKILSGDTIQVVIREQTFMVKYIGVKSPALGIESEPYAIEAALANQSLVQNQVVTLMKDTTDVDADGASLVRYVFVNDVFVNNEIINRGMAQASSMPPNTACDAQFMLAQQTAMENRLGLWQDGGAQAQPTPPGLATPLTTVLPPPAQPCDCNGPDLQCDDFATRADAQACFDSCKALGFGDKFLMDTNQNGIACEGKTP